MRGIIFERNHVAPGPVRHGYLITRGSAPFDQRHGRPCMPNRWIWQWKLHRACAWLYFQREDINAAWPRRSKPFTDVWIMACTCSTGTCRQALKVFLLANELSCQHRFIIQKRFLRKRRIPFGHGYSSAICCFIHLWTASFSSIWS